MNQNVYNVSIINILIIYIYIYDILSKLEINMTKLSNNNSYTYDKPLTDCTQLSKFRYPTDDDISTLIK